MPKLIYFPVQGRAQAIRYLLDAKNVTYEDERIGGDVWGPMKQAATYGAGSQLPIYVNDDGTYMTQSVAILKSLAFDHGYAPTSGSVVFESEWFFATIGDVFEKPERYAMMKDDADEAAQTAALTVLTNTLDAFEGRFADGRAHVGGDHITAADFGLLSMITSAYENPNGKHALIREGAAAKLAGCPHVQRVLTPMRELCAATIAALSASSL
jgi:glutathione S-transferase